MGHNAPLPLYGPLYGPLYTTAQSWSHDCLNDTGAAKYTEQVPG